MGGGTALGLDAIDKAFDGHDALNHASLDVAWGEVHALLGENGAGKSTLMNIVCGLYAADGGSVQIDGKAASVDSPSAATRQGIGMVHQHFKLVGPFTVAENVLLACGRKLNTNSVAVIAERISDVAGQLGFAIDALAQTRSLSVAERQRVEIIKLILLGTDILILDEPTAVLTDEEADAVLALLQDMARQGKAVVLITHRLREVIRFADRVTVMRDGRTILKGADAATMDRADLATAMVGEALSTTSEPAPFVGQSSDRTGLRLEAVNLTRADGIPALTDVNLEVRPGEILGIAGVGGNGQTELTECIYGLSATDSGRILINDQDLSTLNIRQRRELGLRLVPADRFDFALLSEFRAYENLGITEVSSQRYGPAWRLSRSRMKQHARELFEQRDITGGTPTTLTRLLSGGNAQKLLLARELDQQATVLVAHSPTRGLDVRACQSVHHTIQQAAANGAACLLVSEDLDEVLALSHRIAVISRGQLHPPAERNHISRVEIGELMAGHR